MNKKDDVFDLKTLELQKKYKVQDCDRWSEFQYIVTQSEMCNIINSVKEDCAKKVIAEGMIAQANTDDDTQIEWIKVIVDLSVKAIRDSK